MATPTVPRVCHFCQNTYDPCWKKQRYCSKSCGLYGRVRPSARENFMRHVRKHSSGCWIWTGQMSDKNYGKMKLGREQYAHRVAFVLFVGPIAPKDHVLHRCDNPPCVNPDHLFLGSHADNMKDSAVKGRMHPTLTSEQVRAIRADPRTHRAIAADYPVGVSHISRIKAGVRRYHLD